MQQQEHGSRSRFAAALAEASPAESVVLVYEEVIRSLEIVTWAIGQGDIARRFRYADRAIGLVAYLYGNLDMEKGGEVAASLGRSYRLILARLVLINPRNDAVLAREAIQLLRPLLDAWRQVDCLTDAEGGTAALAASLAPTSAPAAIQIGS